MMSTVGVSLAGCATPAPVVEASKLEAVPVYRLGAGDQLRVSVFNEARLSGEYAVGSDGTISFPLVGSVPVSGKTVAEARLQIANSLAAAGYVNNPQVSAQVVASRPFFIQGEIGRPGRYPTSENLSVLRAIAMAGDYTYRAEKTYVYLRREGTEGEVKVLASSDFQVLPGDILRIGERYF